MRERKKESQMFYDENNWMIDGWWEGREQKRREDEIDRCMEYDAFIHCCFDVDVRCV